MKLLTSANNNNIQGSDKEKIEAYINSGFDKKIEDLENELNNLQSQYKIIPSAEDEKRLNKLIVLGILDSNKTISLSSILDFYTENNKEFISSALDNI